MGKTTNPEYCDKCGFIKEQCECKEKITNVDRIRSMTDEELAEFLSEVKYDGLYCKEGMEYPVIPEVWEYWLQSEVEERS